MADPKQIKRFRDYVENAGLPFYEISAATTSGTKELIYGVWERLQQLPPVKQFEAQPLTQEELDDKLLSRNDFKVTTERYIFRRSRLALGYTPLGKYGGLFLASVFPESSENQRYN